MRRLSLAVLLLGAVAWGGAGKHVAVHKGAASTVRLPALSILPNGPVAPQLAAGVLTTQSGVSVTDSRASSVYCTNSSGSLVLLSSNQPCVEASGLRVEQQSTNLALQSGDVTQAAWAQHNTSSAAATGVTDPFGGTGAQTVTDTATAADHYIDQTVSTAAGTATASAYMRFGNVQCVNVEFGSNSDYAVFDLQHGTVSSTGGTGSPTASIQALPNGWYRLIHSATVVSSDVLYIIFNPSCVANHDPTYAGGSGTFTIKGVQVEAGAIATSYIPTTTTAVTRAADGPPSVPAVAIGTKPSFSADFTPVFLTTGYVMDASNSTADEWEMYLDGSGHMNCAYWNGTTSYLATTTSAATAGAKSHFSCSYDGSNLKVCLNGGCVSSALTFTPLSSSYPVYFGARNGGGAPLNVWEATMCADSSSSKCQ